MAFLRCLVHIFTLTALLAPSVFAEEAEEPSGCAERVKKTFPPLHHGDIDTIDRMKHPTTYQPNLAGITFLADHTGRVVQGSALDEHVVIEKFLQESANPTKEGHRASTDDN